MHAGLLRAATLLAVLLVPGVALGLETPIGEPRHVAGMEVGAVYLQPVDMEPSGAMRKAADADIHLEADVHALARNPNGYAQGAWVPFLGVHYVIAKLPAGPAIEGDLMPMVASDGPHYGDNVKLAGPGRYRLTYTVYPPNAPQNHVGQHFGRHTDRATGVAPWFHSFDLGWEFTCAGVGKKGSY